MKKKFFTFFLGLLSVCLLQAQIWDGSAGTSWNDPNNWTPAAVPTALNTITIPNTVNKPVLANDVILTGFNMDAGSALNFNGFTLTVSGSAGFDINGGTLNNSDATTDITITISGTGSKYIRLCTVNDNIIINYNATSGGFFEAYQNPNTFNGNATFNIGGAADFNNCYSFASTFNGNVTVTRTVAGATEIFKSGAVAVTGNFSYTNNIGGATSIHNSGAVVTPISGTINIAATGAGNPVFLMQKIKNLTGGGTISVQNSGLVNIDNDTLLLAALNVNGFTGGGIDDIKDNIITAAINISDGATNTGSHYFRRNIVNGNTTFTCTSAASIFEGYQGGNTFNGNVAFNFSGSATENICYQSASAFNGDLSVTRTVAGVTNILDNGFTALTGNFSYTNTAGGATSINNGGFQSATIGGTVNIDASGPGNPGFTMRKIKNATTGGTISVQNSGAISIENDTLLLNAMNVNGFTSSGTDDFNSLVITGTINISDVAGNVNSIYLRKSTFNGNITYTQNSAAALFESYQGANVYNGNVTLIRNAGTINFAYNDPTTVNQNLTINSAAGIIFIDTVKLTGNVNGAIEQLGTQPIIMPKIYVAKTGGANVTLNDSVMITTRANFISGNVYTSAVNYLAFDDGSLNADASATSHVIGPVIKIGNDVFTFPLGGPVSYNPIGMSAPVGVTSRFRAEYKNQNPTIDGYNTNTKAGSFGAALISNAGYWDVQRLIGVTNVTLTLGFNANPYEQYPVLANLKVAHWNGAQWDDHGNGGTTATTVVNSTPITSFSPFAIAGVIPTYFFTYQQPGPGPDGTPYKISGIGGWPGYNVKELPSGSYAGDSVFLIPNSGTSSFRLKDLYGVEKDTSLTAPAAPTVYISANGNGTKNFTGWRHFVYITNGSNEIIGAIKDNDLTLGNTTMTAYFSTPNVATAPNGTMYLKRSFKITSQYAPVGTKRVRFYISKTEFNNLVAADPTSFPNGINSVTITKYTGPQEDSLFNPIPGGNSSIIPNSAITIADLGTMYSLDIDVTGFSSFYIGGNQSNVSLCNGSNMSLSSDISGATYQWQADNGGGYANIINGGIYSGATTNTLTLANVPTSMYGYKLRAVVNGSLFSQVYTIKFKATWMGTINNVWENAANWNCGIVPDANTDVIISSGKPVYPVINSNTSIRTMTLSAGVTATVNTGITLTILQ
jgi:hypothetical protein